MPAIQITPRILRQAKDNAVIQCNRIRSAYTSGRIKSWSDIERMFSIKVPDTYKNMAFTFANVGSSGPSFCTYWLQSYEARLQHSVEPTEERRTIVVDKKVDTFGIRTLFPEQQGVYTAIYDAFTVNKIQAALQDGYTGSGKTIIACSVIAKLVKEGILLQPDVAWRLHPFIIFCPKGVAENWRRELEAHGLGELLAKRRIYIFADSEFTSTPGKIFVDEHEDLNTGEVSLRWNLATVPILAVIDECHRYVNPKTARFKSIRALLQTRPRKHFLLMSATPMEKVNDSQLFVELISNLDFNGTRVDSNSFSFFAGVLDSTPHKPNREALKRLRKVLAPYIFSIPYVKPKHKAINVVQLVDFELPEHEDIYISAHHRYIEACRKSGKNTLWGRFEAFIALMNYRKTVEPLRAHWIAHRCAENYHGETLATAVGTAFKETITEIAFQLVEKYNIPRDHISIVWGGKKEYKPEMLLTKAEIDDILKQTDLKTLLQNKELLKKVRITLRYLQDQHEHTETAEQQAYRHNKLRELRLVGKQSDNARQVEIDKFQDGSSKIVLFTNASGGIGLSFDRNKESLLPREGLFTPVYSGKEFQQVLGRLVRRASIADAIQRICMMRGTVEELMLRPSLMRN